MDGNGNWYVMRTIPEKESEAAELMERKISRDLWSFCRILRKQQLFRTKGAYLLSRRSMFPGYLFVKTEVPGVLEEELKKSGQFPQLVGSHGVAVVPVEAEDLGFLENVCGRRLEHDMGLSTVRVDGEGRVESAVGALEPYLGRVVRQRLRHRYVTAEVPLFHRVENVLFGIRVEGDPG